MMWPLLVLGHLVSPLEQMLAASDREVVSLIEHLVIRINRWTPLNKEISTTHKLADI